MTFKLENLKVWQKALDLTDEIDKLTKTFSKEELFILTSQIKRVANSISLNRDEGSTGQSNAEFIRFLRYALHSDIEVVGCLHIAKRRKYITKENFLTLYKSCEEVLVMINGLIKSLK